MKAGFMGLDQSLFIVFFVYGLAFFGMGLAMAMEAGRSSALAEARVLRPLAWFGLIHGTHEWLESYLLQAASLGTPLPAWLPWLRLGLLIGSFSSLLLFAFHSLQMVKLPLALHHKIMVYVLAGYILFISLSSFPAYRRMDIPWPNLLDGLSRYLLAVPASALAAMGLRARSLQTREQGPRLSMNLSWAALAFAFYSLTQLFVHPIEMFPAKFLNEEAFIAAVGFPIQLVRAVAATFITISLVRATQASDEIRQRELFSAQQARLRALEEQESLRRELLQHTVRAQEDERARIARELHDETAQTLSAFTLELASLRNEKLNKPDFRKVVERLQNLSNDMARGIYRLVHDLRPAQLDDLGLVPALRFLCEQKCRKFDLQLDFDISGATCRLDPLVETALFRVGQEALKNLAVHSQVKEGRVEIVYGEKDVTLRVEDRGRGFDPTENFRPPHGWGLAGMKERVESIGGTLQIISAPGQGTVIEVCVPVSKKELQ
jgi:signal transduction histidine kinase